MLLPRSRNMCGWGREYSRAMKRSRVAAPANRSQTDHKSITEWLVNCSSVT